MKIFNNIKELWEYFLYCPICEKPCRTISINLNPDEIFLSDPKFDKIDNLLIIKFIANIKNKINGVTKLKGILKINCINNAWSIIDLDSNLDHISDILNKKFLKSKYIPEFWIESHCLFCHSSSAISNDIELDFNNKFLKNIKLELERIEIIIDNSEIYHIEQDYDENKTSINQYFILDDGSLKRKATYKNILLDIDFTSLKRIFNRIKTILVFS